MTRKLKLMTVLGTRPEIIRLSAVMRCADRYFDHVVVHTGQNYDPALNEVFFRELGLRNPDVYLDAVGADLGETMGNIIAKSYKVMAREQPDAVLILGDTNSALSAISAKRLKIPDLPYGSGQPLLGLERERDDQPQDRRSHQRHQPALHRKQPPLPAKRGHRRQNHLRHRLAHARGAGAPPRADRAKRCAQPPGAGEGPLHPRQRPPRGKHRPGGQFPLPDAGHQPHGRGLSGPGDLFHASAQHEVYPAAPFPIPSAGAGTLRPLAFSTTTACR